MTFDAKPEAGGSGLREGTGDYLVPIGTTESGCCKLSSFNGLQPRNSDAQPSSIPTILPINTVSYLDIGGSKLVAIGCAPNGFVALLEAADWDALRSWKLDRLHLAGGEVRACGTGRENGFDVARFLLNPKRNEAVFQRNGNPLDMRRENLVAIPRGLLRQAAIEQTRGPNKGGTVTLRDGRVRTRRQPMTLSATDRVAALLAGNNAKG